MHRLSTIAVYFIIFLVLISELISNSTSSVFIYFLIAAQLIRLLAKSFNKPLEIALGGSFLFLYAVFPINILIFLEIDSTYLICLFIIFSDGLIYFDKPAGVPIGIKSDKRDMDYIGFGISAVAIILTAYLIPIPVLSLMIPIGSALFFQERLLRKGQDKRSALLVFVVFEMSIGVYLLLHWTGYGRLAIASYCLMPFAVLTAYHRLSAEFWHLTLITPFLATFALIVRGGSLDSLTKETAAGVTDHLIYTNNLIKGVITGNVGFANFFEQYILFFLNWFPRDLWPNKPVGVGYYGVDVLGERPFVSDEHNISLGFVGEQIFLLGDHYLIGVLSAFISIVIFRFYFNKFSRANGVAARVAFDMSLITYFWGGMAAFGSRAWFVIIPIMAFSYVSRTRARP